MNKRAEADSLHDAADGYLQPRCWCWLHAKLFASLRAILQTVNVF
jgi:hypothetical protein